MPANELSVSEGSEFGRALEAIEPRGHLVAKRGDDRYLVVRMADLKYPLSLAVSEDNLIAIVPEPYLQMLAAAYGPADNLSVESAGSAARPRAASTKEKRAAGARTERAKARR